MFDQVSILQRSLCGGLGGLIGWVLVALIGNFIGEPNINFLFTGVAIGIPITLACATWENLLCERNLGRALIHIKPAVVMGSIAGIAGVFTGELIYQTFGQGLWSRAIGWGVMGALIGLSDGYLKKMPTRMKLGALGGFLGGLIGGSTYQFLAILLVAFSREIGLAVGGAIGLTLLGMFISGMIGMVEKLLQDYWLIFKSGRLEGHTIMLDPLKGETTLGRRERADISLFGDSEVVADHAVLIPENESFRIVAKDGTVYAGQAAEMNKVQEYVLQPGDDLRFGTTRVTFETGK